MPLHHPTTVNSKQQLPLLLVKLVSPVSPIYAVGEASTCGAGQTSQTSISDMLAAASERVLERCGLEYDETAGMYYDANSALYYDQVYTRASNFLPYLFTS